MKGFEDVSNIIWWYFRTLISTLAAQSQGLSHQNYTFLKHHQLNCRPSLPCLIIAIVHAYCTYSISICMLALSVYKTHTNDVYMCVFGSTVWTDGMLETEHWPCRLNPSDPQPTTQVHTHTHSAAPDIKPICHHGNDYSCLTSLLPVWRAKTHGRNIEYRPCRTLYNGCFTIGFMCKNHLKAACYIKGRHG